MIYINRVIEQPLESNKFIVARHDSELHLMVNKPDEFGNNEYFFVNINSPTTGNVLCDRASMDSASVVCEIIAELDAKVFAFKSLGQMTKHFNVHSFGGGENIINTPVGVFMLVKANAIVNPYAWIPISSPLSGRLYGKCYATKKEAQKLRFKNP